LGWFDPAPPASGGDDRSCKIYCRAA